jgi:hypothetical protein
LHGGRRIERVAVGHVVDYALVDFELPITVKVNHERQGLGGELPARPFGVNEERRGFDTIAELVVRPHCLR